MVDFLTSHCILFTIISVFLILALIGYFIDLKHPDENKEEKEDILTNKEALKLRAQQQGNSTLGTVMNKQNNMNPMMNQQNMNGMPNQMMQQNQMMPDQMMQSNQMNNMYQQQPNNMYTQQNK